MPRVAVVHHNQGLGLGRLERRLGDHEVEHVWAPGADFPDRMDGVVVMGGFMGAYETDTHPWLVEEKRWLAEQVEEETPVLGICLGAQLLADALGGRALRGPRPEVGVIELHLTEAGSTHPVASHLGTKAFFAHGDTFELPPTATLLAATADYPSAFELGSAVGLQPHPEVPLEEALGWVDDPHFDLLERAQVRREDYVRDLRSHEPEADQVAASIFGAWFDSLRWGPSPEADR